jgi:hypothetical protein
MQYVDQQQFKDAYGEWRQNLCHSASSFSARLFFTGSPVQQMLANCLIFKNLLSIFAHAGHKSPSDSLLLKC